MIQHFEKGMTVRELKAIIADWPEIDVYEEPSEVWISTGIDLTSPVIEISQLNSADFLLLCSDDAWITKNPISVTPAQAMAIHQYVIEYIKEVLPKMDADSRQGVLWKNIGRLL
jgi:hypothetical protein